MKLTPIFGLPIAEPDDARRDFPSQVDGPRTTAIEDALAAGTAATNSNVYRTTNTTFAAPGMTALGVGVTIAAAPPGVYLISWNIILSCTVVTTGNLRILMGDGTNLTKDHRVDLAANAAQSLSGAQPLEHEGGDLGVQSYAQVATGTGTVWAGSTAAAVRVGALP